MQFNLLSSKYEEAFKKQVYTRVLYLASVFILVWAIVFGLILYGLSFYLNTQTEEVLSQIETAKAQKENREAQDLEAKIIELNRAINRVEDIRNIKKSNGGALLARVSPMVPPGANLEQFTYSASTNKVFLEGHANERVHVITLQNRLEDDPLFELEDPPLSNLLKSEDIDFEFTLILNNT